MHILGINAYHGGASATLIKDGQLLAAVEEERFTRQKYWAGFPTQSIRYCLSVAGITPQELNHIGISRNPSANLLKKALFTLTNRPSLSFLQDRMKNAGKVSDLKGEFARHLGVEATSLRAEFHNVEHHRAHLASTFFVSPFDDAAILSVDGMGDFVSTMSAVGHANNLRVLDTVHFPHSLGNFYTAITQWLGFPYYGDEGKVMGLAPYGTPRYMDKLAKVIRWKSNGDFELDLDYFATFADGNLMRWEGGSPTMPILFSNALINLLGQPRQPSEEITPYHEDIAASLQAVLEEIELAIVKQLHKKTGRKVLCMAGGVALNSAFNGKILPKTDFEEIFIQPAAGDAGTSLGVCYYIYHQILGKPRNFVMQSSYTGPQFSKAECKAALEKNNLAYWVLDEKSLFEITAEKIASEKVVGWFQGQMEWGPRALGNRSILADPRFAKTKDILNLRIKKREKFRPFAPAILARATGEYFDQTYPDPFMLKVYNVLPEKREIIPAVTHVDGTGRLQTVEQSVNPRYYGVINAFAERTGVPVLLNTSFNENEPIVCTPQEAIDCFLRTQMDVLVLGDYLVERN
jgi:carbamoyltransferase